MVFSSLYGNRLTFELGTDDVLQRFTTARRKSAINQGLTEFANLTECLVRWSSVTIVGGVPEYSLTSTSVFANGDFLRFGKDPVEFIYFDNVSTAANVTVLTGDDLVRRDISWLNVYEPGWQPLAVSTVTGMQLPRYYYVRHDGGDYNLGFYPTPSTATGAAAKSLFSYIAQCPTLVADTDEPFTFSSVVRSDLRPYHQGAVHYGAYLLEKLRRDKEAQDSQLQKFMTYVSRYVQEMRVKGGRTITQARTYFRFRGKSVTPAWQDDPRIR